MKSILLFALFFILFYFEIQAGGDPVPVGARSWGLANASLTFKDAFALFNNPAGLGGLKNINAFASFDNRYGISGMNTFSAGFNIPFKFGNIGLGIQRFGGELYNEQQLSLAWGQQIRLVNIGLKTSLLQISLGEYGVKRTVTFEFGAIAEIIPKQLFLAASIYNFNQAKLAEYQDERVPTVMKAGFSYRPISNLMINAETEKDIDFPAIVKAGLEYEIIKHFKLRTGISSKPYVNYFGFGLNPKSIQFDYSLRTHPQLGMSHHISLAYKFKEKKK